ncbi:MAG: hypothetical protein J7M38_11605, partial [Armatimonadetes bacterium]|nr:hypothetical protein [Armatimonadota bacterium]
MTWLPSGSCSTRLLFQPMAPPLSLNCSKSPLTMMEGHSAVKRVATERHTGKQVRRLRFIGVIPLWRELSSGYCLVRGCHFGFE